MNQIHLLRGVGAEPKSGSASFAFDDEGDSSSSTSSVMDSGGPGYVDTPEGPVITESGAARMRAASAASDAERGYTPTGSASSGSGAFSFEDAPPDGGGAPQSPAGGGAASTISAAQGRSGDRDGGDYSTTSITYGAWAQRPQRVSPLGVSWQSPFQPRQRAQIRQPLSMGWAMAAFGLMFGGVALFLIASPREKR